jgi:hypothetical protein
VSKLWAYSGLHVIDGRAARRKKGERANWSQFLKTKMLGVLAPSFLKCSSPYRSFYDDYRHRLESIQCSLPPVKHANRFAGHPASEDQPPDASQSDLDDQIATASQGIVDDQNEVASHPDTEPQDRLASLLPNGCTKAHMHNKAMRYMVKRFLADLYVQWRTIRGLTVRPPYAEEYLGRVHSGQPASEYQKGVASQ